MAILFRGAFHTKFQAFRTSSDEINFRVIEEIAWLALCAFSILSSCTVFNRQTNIPESSALLGAFETLVRSIDYCAFGANSDDALVVCAFILNIVPHHIRLSALSLGDIANFIGE